MAVEFEIVSDGGPTTADLWDGTYTIIEKSWATANPWPEGDYRHVEFGAQLTFSHYPPHSESCALVTYDSEADIFASQKALEALFQSALNSNINPIRNDWTWLHAKADTESAKRALLYRAMCTFPPRDGVNFWLDGVPSAVLVAAMSFDRHPFWESYYAQSYPTISDTGLDAIGDTFSYANVPGTHLARIAKTAISSSALTAITKVWIGAREAGYGYGSTAAFNPRVECENAALPNGALYSGAAVVADVSASSNNKVQVPFNVSAAFGARFDMRFGDFLAGPALLSYEGRYTLLMRAQVTAGATVRVQARYGQGLLAGSTDLIPAQGQDTYITDSTWQLFELGEIVIPPYATFDLLLSITTYFRLQIWAEHISGTAATDVLDCDTFVLVPSEHMVRVDGTKIDTIYDIPSDLTIYTLPNDEIVCVNEENSIPTAVPQFAPRLWYLPQGDGLIVVAGQEASGSVKGDTLDAEMTYIPRWMSYRDT